MSERGKTSEIRVDVNYAIELITDIFKAKSCNNYEAKTIAERLCGSNLKGHDSHGIVRVPRYVLWMEWGWVFPNIKPDLIAFYYFCYLTVYIVFHILAAIKYVAFF